MLPEGIELYPVFPATAALEILASGKGMRLTGAAPSLVLGVLKGWLFVLGPLSVQGWAWHGIFELVQQ